MKFLGAIVLAVLLFSASCKTQRPFIPKLERMSTDTFMLASLNADSTLFCTTSLTFDSSGIAYAFMHKRESVESDTVAMLIIDNGLRFDPSFSITTSIFEGLKTYSVMEALPDSFKMYWLPVDLSKAPVVIESESLALRSKTELTDSNVYMIHFMERIFPYVYGTGSLDDVVIDEGSGFRPLRGGFYFYARKVVVMSVD